MKNSRERLIIVLLCAVVFAAGVFGFTRWNTFAWFYHPDEPGKAQQLISGEWNLHHPVLMLVTAEAALKTADVPREPREVVITGRWVSAAFAAGAAALFAVVAWLLAGNVAAAVAGGGALVLHQQLFELAHYFKEDTALLFGISAAMVGLVLAWQGPQAWRAAVLGAGCALAGSGKYIGLVFLLPALVVLVAQRDNRARRSMAFVAALVTVFCLVNLPMFGDAATFKKSFDRELEMVVEGQRGMTRSIPHDQYWNSFHENTTPVIWALLLVHLWTLWRTRREQTLLVWIVTLLPFLYGIMLSFSPKSNDRYFLPATALFILLAALAIRPASVLLSRWMSQRVAQWLIVAVSLVGQVPSLVPYMRAFRNDDRQDLQDWVAATLPVSAVIVQDAAVGLPNPNKRKSRERQQPIPQTVLGEKYAAETGTLSELQARGITHVAVSRNNYGRFFLESLKPQEDYEEEFLIRKQFYEELFASGKLLWSRPRGKVTYLHPGIEVYSIQP